MLSITVNHIFFSETAQERGTTPCLQIGENFEKVRIYLGPSMRPGGRQANGIAAV